MFILRFDLRCPGGSPAERSALHRTAVEMSAWVDRRGCLSIVLSEHHAAGDGYLPAPAILAGAIAGATEVVGISIAATLLPLHHPARLAEELIVLDHLSQGRVSTVLGVGYRPEEYALYETDFDERGSIADTNLISLLQHLGGETELTPRAYTAGGPPVAWGGASKVAARRAGRHGIGFAATTSDETLRDAYLQAAAEAGREPGPILLPDPAVPMAVFVNDDLDEGWAEVGPSLLVDAIGYADWNDPATTNGTASLSAARSVDALRSAEGSHRVVTVDEAVDLIHTHGFLGLHPLAGGLDPRIAWTYLRRIADDVLPRLTPPESSNDIAGRRPSETSTPGPTDPSGQPEEGTAP